MPDLHLPPFLHSEFNFLSLQITLYSAAPANMEAFINVPLTKGVNTTDTLPCLFTTEISSDIGRNYVTSEELFDAVTVMDLGFSPTPTWDILSFPDEGAHFQNSQDSLAGDPLFMSSQTCDGEIDCGD